MGEEVGLGEGGEGLRRREYYSESGGGDVGKKRVVGMKRRLDLGRRCRRRRRLVAPLKSSQALQRQVLSWEYGVVWGGFSSWAQNFTFLSRLGCKETAEKEKIKIKENRKRRKLGVVYIINRENPKMVEKDYEILGEVEEKSENE